MQEPDAHSATHFGLTYDAADQLSSDAADSGSSYNIYISGNTSAAETFTVTAYDASLVSSGGQITATYSASSGASPSTIATALASSIGTAMNSSLGVTASVNSPGVITISTSPSYATTFSCARSGNGTSLSLNVNSADSYTVNVGGALRSGDSVSVTAYDTAIGGSGSESATVTVASGNTVYDVAANLAASISYAMANINVTAYALCANVII